LRFLQLRQDWDDTNVIVFDDAIARNLKRLRVESQDDELDLSDRIKWKLFLARQMAILKGLA